MSDFFSLRLKIFSYAKEKYNTEPEYLWAKFPDYAVLRSDNNRKWYALIMDIPKNKLGNFGSEKVDIINLKMSDPLAVELLTQKEGFFRGYHISHGNWISVLLDGTVPVEEILPLIDESFNAVSGKKTVKK